MKLFPVLAATLFQESQAACNGPVISVNCRENLVVELTGKMVRWSIRWSVRRSVRRSLLVIRGPYSIFILVDKTCLTENFEYVAITDLQINPTDATGDVPDTQCLPCTTLPCDTAEHFTAYDFSLDNPTMVGVTDSSTKLYFKAGQCGTTMDVVGDKARLLHGFRHFFDRKFGLIDIKLGCIKQYILHRELP